jgi:hypothetical protein
MVLASQMPIVEGKGCQFGFLLCWVDAFGLQGAENCKRPLSVNIGSYFLPEG